VGVIFDIYGSFNPHQWLYHGFAILLEEPT